MNIFFQELRFSGKTPFLQHLCPLVRRLGRCGVGFRLSSARKCSGQSWTILENNSKRYNLHCLASRTLNFLLLVWWKFKNLTGGVQNGQRRRRMDGHLLLLVSGSPLSLLRRCQFPTGNGHLQGLGHTRDRGHVEVRHFSFKGPYRLHCESEIIIWCSHDWI